MNWLYRFMYGRNGADQFSFALLIMAALVTVIGGFFRNSTIISMIIWILSYLLLAYSLFRILSRNLPRRRQENEKFMSFWRPISLSVSAKIARMKDSKTHRYFSCPKCGVTVRVPKGKGKIEITCPKCSEVFIKKT